MTNDTTPREAIARALFVAEYDCSDFAISLWSELSNKQRFRWYRQADIAIAEVENIYAISGKEDQRAMVEEIERLRVLVDNYSAFPFRCDDCRREFLTAQEVVDQHATE